MKVLAIINATKIWGVTPNWGPVPTDLLEDYSLANAVLSVNGVIDTIGTTKKVLARYEHLRTEQIASSATASSSFNIVDCFNKHPLYPGFIDAHLHFLDGGRRLEGNRSVSLRNISNGKEEIIQRLKDYIQKHQLPTGTWIKGGDWNEEDWGGRETSQQNEDSKMICKEWLDEATTEHPVFLARYDSHSAVCNSLALRLAGVDKDGVKTTPDPFGGTIERRPTSGEPTGILRETAQRFVKQIWPKVDTQEGLEKALQNAQDYLLSRGVTTCATMTSLEFANVPEIAFLHEKEMQTQQDGNDGLKMRVRCAVRRHEMEELEEYTHMQSDAKIKQTERGVYPKVLVGPVKVFADGSLGSRTCCMKERFADVPEGSVNAAGMLMEPLEQLRQTVQTIVKKCVSGSKNVQQMQETKAADHTAKMDANLHSDSVLHATGDVQRVVTEDADGSNKLSLTAQRVVQENRWRSSIQGTDTTTLQWQLCVHTIGDKAASDVIQAIEDLSKMDDENVQQGACTLESIRQTKCRIEHCQIITNPEDIQRLANIGGVGSVQPLQLVFDGPGVVSALGATRATRDTYPFRSLLQNGVPLVGGSDWMVVDADVTLGVLAATTRLALAPTSTPTRYDWYTWEQDQSLSIEEAVNMYTTEAAKGNNCGSFLGAIRVGFAADFVVMREPFEYFVEQAVEHQDGLFGSSLSKAPFPARAGDGRNVVYTVVDGDIVFESEQLLRSSSKRR